MPIDTPLSSPLGEEAGAPPKREFAPRLDAAILAQARSGDERAEMARLAIRADVLGNRLTLLTETPSSPSYKAIYYLKDTPFFRVRLATGTLVLDHPRDALAALRAACIRLHDAEKFDSARLIVPQLAGTRAHWIASARAPARPLLLIFGFRKQNKERLPLADSYEDFVNGLGRHTRRNIRRIRRLAVESGFRFALRAVEPAQGVPDRVYELCGKNGPIPFMAAQVDKWESETAGQSGHFRSSIETGSGEVFSICRGFHCGGSAFIMYQLNDRAYYPQSPSLLHRALLAEALIARGVREIIFFEGYEGLLKHVCPITSGASVVIVPLTLKTAAKAATVVLSRLRTALNLVLEMFFKRSI